MDKLKFVEGDNAIAPNNPFTKPPATEIGHLFRGDYNDLEGTRLASTSMLEGKF